AILHTDQPAFEAVEISDLSLNDNPTRAIRTLHRSDPRRPGVLLRRYDTTGIMAEHRWLLNCRV
ncbi:hypothetical protein M3F59_15405, partial [Brachybacterium muris]|uniref:hypothetical protein n=1 Tax=Brachybacterium muris TaxID=219301 RepID=UPI00223A7191